ncbi:tetratricopeptide repeat protein, partial [bacterium]|nr:tetratricopeptide repeat protein [bacterium]
NQVENLSDYSLEEFNALQERLQILRAQMAEEQQSADNIRMLIQGRQTTLAEMEKTMANAAQNKESMPSFTGSLPGASEAASAEYQRGLASFYSRQYDSGIRIFQELLNQGGAGPLESNCHYWIGECYYGKRQYQAALQGFAQVLNYQISPKLDDALLMGGKCMLNLGDIDGARVKFQQLRQEFPDSEFFPKAEHYLSRM